MRPARCLCLLLFAFAMAVPAFAVPGATDRVAGASLLVPFFETGVNSGTHPHDTLLVVTNWRTDNRRFHYHVWDIDGNPTDLNGNITLTGLGSWNVAMRDLITVTSAAVRAQLTEGAFFRGFVTIDAIALGQNPAIPPTNVGFVFADTNVFEGFIYYTRLSQGSANGLAMVALEHVPPASNSLLRGFYRGSDNREEIDPTARRCARRLSTGGDCASGIDGALARIHLRAFRSVPLNGTTRAVVFTWVPFRTGGPSLFCDVPASGCNPNYIFRQYDQNGAILLNTTIRLDHVVNVIEDSSLTGTSAGWLSIFNVTNVQLDLQVYAFSFNSANPAGNPDLTWDAIFEGFIITDDAI